MSIGTYLRVSSKTQDTRSQEPDLQTWARAQPDEVTWFKDKFTATVTDRPGLDRLLADVRRDAAGGGHKIVYRSADGEQAVLSGGRPIIGWQPDAGGRWKATTNLGNFRQLYVDGKRAVRARGGALPGAELHGKDGYKTTAVEMADWKNQADIEFCYYVVWCHTRCKVRDIKREGDRAIVTMLQPHFTHAREKEGVHVALPNYIENALELLDEPGEWYLDRAAKTVYYKPLPDQDMSKVRVVAPAVEKLVELRGTLDQPVENIHFVGLTFAEAGWLVPSAIGLVDVQANFLFIEVTGNVVYNVRTPMNYNHRSQNRIATCNEHDNFFGIRPGGPPHAAGQIEKVVEKAGLMPEYRDLLKK